ncbi:MAG: TolC family protein [Magnetococcales bacterium]|nr:TolC family protein [Magnetococcales bacterium]MBF0151853.1 TolC family protein [Magnetococcales bacterium]
MLVALATALLSGCSVLVPAITTQEREQMAKLDEMEMFKGQKALVEPLTLYEAMARAIKYNLEFRAKRMEESVAKSEEELFQLDMLPKVLASAGYTNRTGNAGSVSQSLTTGIMSQDPTTSRGTANGTMDLAMSWNMLDFGVSYFQARQEGNKRLIQAEQRRKAAHNLIKDVRFAFWKAASAQWLEKEIAAVLQTTDAELALARQVENEGLRSPVHALQFQLNLLDIARQLEKTQADLAVAKEELAALINLEPGVSFRLSDDSGDMISFQKLSMPLGALENMALSLRPELRIEQYQARVEADETRKGMARLFPGLELSVSENFDDNAFLVYQHWAQAGARLSMSLLRTLNAKPQLDLGENRERLVQIRRHVMHMAVLSQVRIALHEYRAARSALQRVVMENKVRRRLQNDIAFRTELGLDSQFNYVQTAATSALGRIQRYEAFARYQSALGRLYVSLGLNPVDDKELDADVPHLMRALRANDSRCQEMIFFTSEKSPMVDVRVVPPLSLVELTRIDVAPSSKTNAVASSQTETIVSSKTDAVAFITPVSVTSSRTDPVALPKVDPVPVARMVTVPLPKAVAVTPSRVVPVPSAKATAAITLAKVSVVPAPKIAAVPTIRVKKDVLVQSSVVPVYVLGRKPTAMPVGERRNVRSSGTRTAAN